jgi:uroporphyrinogen decarboxylase
MTRRELVNSTLEFRNRTGCVPREIWTLPVARQVWGAEFDRVLAEFPNDVLTARPKLRERSPVTRGDMYTAGTYTDDWGCVFLNRQNGIVGEVKTPQIRDDDWSGWASVHIPENWLSFDPDEVNAFCAGTDGFVLAGCYPRPFEQLQFIRGTENLMMDLTDPPANLLRFLERMHDFYCRLLEKWACTQVDALMIMDDWGTQRDLLVSPETWKTLFRPLYRDYIDIAKKHGKKMFMHSDGCTLRILPELIDLGLDAINTQIFCMDFEKLREFRGKLTFWGEIDRQIMLPYGKPAEIRDAVDRVMENLWQDGGVIAQLEFGLGARPENVRAAFDQWNRYGARGART